MHLSSLLYLNLGLNFILEGAFIDDADSASKLSQRYIEYQTRGAIYSREFIPQYGMMKFATSA